MSSNSGKYTLGIFNFSQATCLWQTRPQIFHETTTQSGLSFSPSDFCCDIPATHEKNEWQGHLTTSYSPSSGSSKTRALSQVSYGNRKQARSLGSSMAHPQKRDFTSGTDTQDHLPGPDVYKHVAVLCVHRPALTQTLSSSSFPRAC